MISERYKRLCTVWFYLYESPTKTEVKHRRKCVADLNRGSIEEWHETVLGDAGSLPCFDFVSDYGYCHWTEHIKLYTCNG